MSSEIEKYITAIIDLHERYTISKIIDLHDKEACHWKHNIHEIRWGKICYHEHAAIHRASGKVCGYVGDHHDRMIKAVNNVSVLKDWNSDEAFLYLGEMKKLPVSGDTELYKPRAQLLHCVERAYQILVDQV